LARLGDALKEGETAGLPWQLDENKPKARHLAKEENRCTVLDPYAVAAIRLLILTGARPREILHARWQEVDFERGILFLPDSKTGRKPVYLSAAALAILNALPRVEGNLHIVPGEKAGQPRADLKKPWAAVTNKAAALEGLRIRDLRHSFASFGAGASLGLPIIGKLLGHTQASTTHRYAHWMPTRCGGRWKQSARRSKRRWPAARRAPQVVPGPARYCHPDCRPRQIGKTVKRGFGPAFPR
jgi:integrase